VTATAIADLPVVELLDDYETHVASLGLKSQHSARMRAARVFLDRWPDLDQWMQRPTPTRLRDLHRLKGWPLLSWALVSGRLHSDLELLLAKPGGCGLTALWCDSHPDDTARVAEAGQRLGWSDSWIRQVSVLALPVLCLWAGKRLDTLDDHDFDAVIAELDQVVHVSDSARLRVRTRLFGLSQVCFQLRVTSTPRRKAGPVRSSPAEHAARIVQPEIRREAIRYAETIATTLSRATVGSRIKALLVFFDWLAENHPNVVRLNQLRRTDHIEPFLVWDATRPWRGDRGRGRIISRTQFHHDIIDLRVFFEDIASWGWPCQPIGRLLFTSDIPRIPSPLPRALPPDVDRALMGAVSRLEDRFTRTGLLLLRATGMRVGELLDLELDCLMDFGPHGTWLRVPLGKLATERMVPLEADTLAVLDAWTETRGAQRPIPQPKHDRPVDFLFLEGGVRPTAWRLRKGLLRAAADAGLHGTDGRPLKVTPHLLRHTYGTELINGGMSLQALMALLGHVSPEMTLRYAKLANPTIRDAYDNALAKIRFDRRLPIAVTTRSAQIPDRIAWLHDEMIKTRLAHGTCTREPAAGPCPYANICEQCDNFVPTLDSAPVLAAQLADVQALRGDADRRGWLDEVARHDRLIDALKNHLHAVTPDG
jgi:integrase